MLWLPVFYIFQNSENKRRVPVWKVRKYKKKLFVFAIKLKYLHVYNFKKYNTIESLHFWLF